MPLLNPDEAAQAAGATTTGPQPTGGGLLSPDEAAQQAGLPQAETGAAHDAWWSSAANAGARVLNSLGMGPAQQWGANAQAPAFELSPEESAALKGFGDMKAYKEGHESFWKGVTDAYVKPSINFAAAVGGGLLSAPAQAIEHVGEAAQAISPAGAPLNPLAEAIGAIPAGEGAEFGFGALGEATTRIEHAAALNKFATDAAVARSVGAVGEGEAGFYDAVPITPEHVQARNAAVAEAGLETPPPPSRPPPVDMDELARRIEPDLFKDYDAAALEREQHTQEIARLETERETAPETVAARDELYDLLGVEGEVSGRELMGRMEAVQASGGEDLVARVNAAFDRYDSALFTDSPEMAAARAAYLDADHAMRDMAPDVSDAYRRAREMAPDLPLGEPKPAPTAEEAAKPAVAAEGEPQRTPQEEAGARAAPIAGLSEAQAEKAVAPPNVVGEEEGRGETVTQGNAPAATKTKVTSELKGIKGEGEERNRRVAERSEENAIATGLEETREPTATYKGLRDVDQARVVRETMDVDYERAKAIAMGTREPPAGASPEAFLIGVENRARAEGDFETVYDLRNSKLAKAGTTMGQRISTYRTRSDNSPVEAMQDVQRARAAAHPNLERDTNTTVAEMRNEVKKVAPKLEAMSNFLKAIECGE